MKLNRFLLFLLAFLSFLWARDIDESVIGGSKNLTLNDVLCKGCQVLRENSTDSTVCESCADYVSCRQDGYVVTYASGPMGGWTSVESVSIAEGNVRNLPKCKVRFTSNLGLHLGMTKTEVLKTGLHFRQTTDSTWEWLGWKRLGSGPDEYGNDWHEWKGRNLKFCNDKLCEASYWCNGQDSGPGEDDIKEFSTPYFFIKSNFRISKNCLFYYGRFVE